MSSPASSPSSASNGSTAQPVPTIKLTTVEGFICGGIAASGAVLFSNPMEVAKTRLQLDGELAKSSEHKRVYTSAYDAIKKTWKNEGFRGINRGLYPAFAYQICLNGCRLGLYEPFRRRINKTIGRSETQQLATVNLLSGASSGIVGAIAGNPLFLVKARIQAYSPANPAGVQHNYKGGFDALTSIFKSEGFKGLYRGVDAAMLRTAMGSSVQLPAYNLAKSYLGEWGWFAPGSIFNYILASTFSGASVCIVMQPADTALTRMYNQSPNALGPDGKPKGLMYKNPIDCLYKTWKVEGVRGLYKGSTAHLLRIAPHTVLTLVFNEQVVQQYSKFKAQRQTSDTTLSA